MEQAKKTYIDLFDEERKDWKEKISIIANDLKSISTVGKAQIDLFTNRQQLLEYSFELAQHVTKLNTKLKKQNSMLYKKYSENSDVRYQSTEKKILIEGDLSDLHEKIDMVEGHRKFIDQTIQTVDHMLYGVRQRISLEDYIRASSGSIK